MIHFRKKFFITTAIDYPNSSPHLGHAYEKICADAIARFKRLQGFDVHFSTGTDEHGLKVQRAAEKAGILPKEFVDNMAKKFIRLCNVLDISYDDFIRTTEQRHWDAVRKLFDKINAKGGIYKGTYSGYYCVGCETFYDKSQLEDGNCRIHKKKADFVEEESYFFKMGKYQNFLLDHIKKNKKFIQPESRANEILSRLEEPLRDLSISRTTFEWGIPFPTDDKHVMYVWMDALVNYLSTIDYPNSKFERYWPCDIHLVGKDIVWHHTVIWGSILRAAGVPLPKTVFGHGFVNIKGRKMSKSEGSVVDPIEVAENYGSDSVRYYLLSEIPFGEDGDFSEEALIERTNSDLVDNYCNLFYRITYFIEKNFSGKVPEGRKGKEKGIEEKSEKAIKNYIRHFSDYRIRDALLETMKLSSELNKYFQEKKAWENPQQSGEELYTAVNILHDITSLLLPFVPSIAKRGLEFLGTGPSLSSRFALKPGHKIKANILKKRIESRPKKVKRKKEKQTEERIELDGNVLPFSEFKKVEMRVATITKVEDHPDADKLYVLTIDLGDEQRKLVAGLREIHTKDDLKNRQVIVVTNLEQKELRGIRSEGMLLAAEDGTLISPAKKVPNGSKIM